MRLSKFEELVERLPGFGFYGVFLLVVAVVLHFFVCEWISPRNKSYDQDCISHHIILWIHSRPGFVSQVEGSSIQKDNTDAALLGVCFPALLAGVGIAMLAYMAWQHPPPALHRNRRKRRKR